MPLTLDEKIAQLQAIRDQHGGDLVIQGVQPLPSLVYKLNADGQEELYSIRYLPD